MTKSSDLIRLAVVQYPQSLLSAVWGWLELFELAGQICRDRQLPWRLSVDRLTVEQIGNSARPEPVYDAVLLPPSLVREAYLEPDPGLLSWLTDRHREGSILASACAGAFLTAATGLLDGREATTHWALIDLFRQTHPRVLLKADQILVNDGDIVTSGGIMAWLDLGLELVAQFSSPAVMRLLGKTLVVDTGPREQRYYQQFTPRFSHGDELILQVQKALQTDFRSPVRMKDLADSVFMTERTFLRRFVRATGQKPHEYLQRLRMQKACELLESTRDPFEIIVGQLGYEDVSACRKLFHRIMGLTPGEFRKRFASLVRPS